MQGVGFRQSMRATAESLGCTGWVRNRPDGSVEALVQGLPESVDTLIAWARHGPPAARVDAIEIIEAQGEFQRFEIVPSS